MAFTLAHPAAVINFTKKHKSYINNAAMILGTMAPDFEYFIHFKPMSVIGHSIKGFLLINLPLVILLYFIFYKVIKNDFISNLPRRINQHLNVLYNDKIKLNSFKEFIIFSYSSFIGMATHVVWDSFTHKNGFFVNKIDVLSNTILNIPIYKYLQHGSTILGFMIIIGYILKLEKIQVYNYDIDEKIKYWLQVILISIFIFLIIFIIKGNFSIGEIVIAIMNSGFLSVLLISLIRLNLKKIESNHY
ncbi:DUF4184 family protein [Sporanaerobacter acetigenes]|uniref:DUF4184 family protein n=1 Tax=Sporanaerobacter acetigenes DSM 13106 TaxID=1123281 RepID=A0A1M5Z6U7_9FIRM|nr:DUF4184 family protein [Sporanaerobacter acetigenes]SHI19977.1 protein of unknown function [Sporanaerobacter acetigenes DSM 13106]